MSSQKEELSGKETTHQTLLARIQINVKSLFIVLETSLALLKSRAAHKSAAIELCLWQQAGVGSFNPLHTP